MGSSKPFNVGTVYNAQTGFAPSCFSRKGDFWFIGGTKNGHTTVVMNSSNFVTNKRVEFTSLSDAPTGIGYTSNGYLVISTSNWHNGICYMQKDIATSSDTDSTAFTLFKPVSMATGADVVMSGDQVYIPGFANTTGSPYADYVGANYAATSVPTFTASYSPRWDGVAPHNAALFGTRAIAINSKGIFGWKSSVGALYLSGSSTIASDFTGKTAQKVAGFGETKVVAGRGSDGIYIWYSNDAFVDESMTFTEKKISSVVADVYGIGYIRNRFVVCYGNGNNDGVLFWVSNTNNVSGTLVSDYAESKLSNIGTVIGMKTLDGETAIIGSAVNALSQPYMRFALLS